MGNNGKRFRKMWNSFREKMTRFMAGRYGMDRLNSLLLWVSMAFVLVAMFLPRVLRLSFTFLAYLLMGFAIFRLLSRNAYRRYKENRWLLLLIDRIKDKEHRYYTCPRCRQLVRVPRGKGKISITCPTCKEKFIKKT